MTDQNQTQRQDSLTSVQEWIRKQGYPLEFHVANKLLSSGFHVTQSYYVSDINKVDTNREIDIVASVEYEKIKATLIIECKYTISKPWIIFSSLANKVSVERYIQATIGTKGGHDRICALVGDDVIKNLTLFQGSTRSGYLARQAHASESADDLTFRVFQAVSGNALSLVKQAHRQGSVLFFPIVVIDGHLYECYYDEQKQDVVTVPTPKMRVHWRANNNRYLVNIDVVTKSHLEDYLVILKRDLDVTMLSMARLRHEYEE